MRFNLKTTFEAIGLSFVKELKDNIRGQIDITGSKFSKLKPSTLAARASKVGLQKKMARITTKAIVPRTGRIRKSVAKTVPDKRLFFSERFWLGAFKHRSTDEDVEIFVNRGSYPVRAGESPVRYDEIVHHNNLGDPDVNKDISKPPLIFPNTIEQVRLMRAWKQAEDRMRTSFQSGEIAKVIAEQGIKDMQVELNITL